MACCFGGTSDSTTSDSTPEYDLGSGREVLYMFGGALPDFFNERSEGNVLQRYDFDRDQWVIVKRKREQRRNFFAVVAYEECIWVIGGMMPNGRATRSVLIYNPKTGHWSNGPSMRYERHSFCAIVIDGAIYAVGGVDGRKDLCETESFTSGSGWVERTPMYFQRSNFAIAARNLTIYALGGNSKIDAIARSVESYPIRRMELRSWQIDATGMPNPRRGPKAAIVNDKLYVVGGDEGNTVAVKDFAARPLEWIEISELRHVPSDFDVVPYGSRLYVVGTVMKGKKRTFVEVFDTESEEWTSSKRPIGKPIPSLSAVIEKEYSRL